MTKVRMVLVGLLALVAVGACTATASAGPFAYVTSAVDNTLTPIDLATNTAQPAFPTGYGTIGVVITPNGKNAFVSHDGDDVTPVDLRSRTAGTPIHTGPALDMAVTPDGRYVYFIDGPWLQAINVASGHVTNGVLIPGEPDDLAISPDGKTAYVSGYLGTFTTVDLTTFKVERTIKVPYAGPIAVTPDGTIAYVINDLGNTVTPVDTQTGEIKKPIFVAYPAGIAIPPDGGTAYVSDVGIGTITPIDLRTRQTGAPIEVGGNPSAIAITPDSNTAYVVDQNNNVVTPVDLTTDTAETAIPVGNNPQDIVIAPPSPGVSVMCEPADVTMQQTSTCAATVSDVAGGSTLTPTGTVGFAIRANGSVVRPACTLQSSGTSASCSMTYSPASDTDADVTATYHGDPAHPSGQAKTTITVSGSSR